MASVLGGLHPPCGGPITTPVMAIRISGFGSPPLAPARISGFQDFWISRFQDFGFRDFGISGPLAPPPQLGLPHPNFVNLSMILPITYYLLPPLITYHLHRIPPRKPAPPTSLTNLLQHPTRFQRHHTWHPPYSQRPPHQYHYRQLPPPTQYSSCFFCRCLPACCPFFAHTFPPHVQYPKILIS